MSAELAAIVSRAVAAVAARARRCYPRLMSRSDGRLVARARPRGSVLLSFGAVLLLAGCGGLVAGPSTDGGTDPQLGPSGDITYADAGAVPVVHDAGDVADANDGGDPAVDAGDPGPPLGPPAGAADGVCFAGDVRLGTYDPDCVYVLGTTAPGASYRAVLFDPGDPSRLVAGFGTFQNGPPRIRPSDGKLLFTTTSPDRAFVFHPGLQNEPEPAQYARHTLLPTPACTVPVGLSGVLVYPDKPGGLYACGVFTSHYYPFGTSTEYAPTSLYRIDSLGPNDTALVRSHAAFLVIDGGVAHPVAGIAADKTIAARARSGGGFFVAQAAGYNGEFPRLYAIALDGSANDVGAYMRPTVQLSSAALEPSGALITFAQGDGFGYGVMRLRVDAPPETLFVDTPAYSAHLHMPQLVTGP